MKKRTSRTDEENLLLAAASGLTKTVQRLLAKGTNPNVQAPSGASPLYLAAKFGHEKCVRELLNAGANVNIESKLYSLIEKDKSDAIKSKVREGLDPNIISPLCAATAGKHYNIMKLLLDKGANPYKLSPYGYALSKTSYRCTEILDNDKVSMQLHPYTAAHIAAMNNDVKALRLLKIYQEDMNFSAAFDQLKWKNFFGAIEKYHVASTPFHAAAASGSLGAASFLCNEKQQVNQLACDKLPYIRADGSLSDSHIGLTALHLAGKTGNKAMAKLLLMYGATVNYEGRRPLFWLNMYEPRQWTPLDFAVMYGKNIDTINLLIEQGGHLNYWKDHLQHAVKTNDVWLTEQLFNFKKDKKPDLSSYLYIAVVNNRVDIAQILLRNGARVTDALIATAEDSDYPKMTELLNAHKHEGLSFSTRVKRFFCLPAESSSHLRSATALSLGLNQK